MRGAPRGGNHLAVSEAESYHVSANWQVEDRFGGKLPPSADVVIIGGGIVGVSTAWFLAKRGLHVVLCEKGAVACEQSGRNWGWVRQQGRDPRELPMMIESRRIWQELEHEIGEDVGFAECGCLFLASDEDEIEHFERWLPIAKEHDLDTEIISGEQLDLQVMHGGARWPAALYTASDCRAEPHKAAPAIARAAGRAGADILTRCAVRGIETSAGRVSAVVTEHGPIRAGAVLCAAGAWTGMFCRSLDIPLPQLRVRGTVARTAAAPKLFNGCVFDARLGIRRRQDGGYTIAHGAVLDHPITPTTLRYAFKFLPALKQEWRVLRLSLGREFIEELRTPSKWPLDRPSPFETRRVLNPAPNPKVLAGIEQNLAAVFPALAGTPLVETWAGIVETTPDVVPIIGEEPGLPGFYVATGLSGHGFGIGPGAGKAIAALIAGENSGIDLSPFRRERFFDGSPIEPMRSV